VFLSDEDRKNAAKNGQAAPKIAFGAVFFVLSCKFARFQRGVLCKFAHSESRKSVKLRVLNEENV